MYGIFDREIIKYTVIYGVYSRFWPTLSIYYVGGDNTTKQKSWAYFLSCLNCRLIHSAAAFQTVGLKLEMVVVLNLRAQHGMAWRGYPGNA
jgi:Zn-finger protein